MTEGATIMPVRVPETFVLSKCEYFVDVQLWPIETRLNPQAWLQNFTSQEMDHAVHLLSAFTYFSGHLVAELFKAAFQGLSRYYIKPTNSYVQNEEAWEQFRRNLLVTHVTGENPSVTDSGILFSRLARQELGIDEARIVSPEVALAEILANGPRPIVFVDDFVGSGQQFLTTWNREIRLGSGQTTSFERVSRIRGTSFFYCPIVCSSLGRETVENACRAVRLVPAHFLTDRYSALSSDSLVWPERLRPTAGEFLHIASQRAGIPEGQWQGFSNLALTIAFEHSIPDATLPLFYATGNGWRPLMRRS
jgi:hypothetical protein